MFSSPSQKKSDSFTKDAMSFEPQPAQPLSNAPSMHDLQEMEIAVDE